MSARMMCNNVIRNIDLTLEKFTPKKAFEFILVKDLEPLELVHKLTY
jgi:hypothetical protein